MCSKKVSRVIFDFMTTSIIFNTIGKTTTYCILPYRYINSFVQLDEMTEFCKKWCEILNHCSMNLMLLIMEFTKKETKSLSEKNRKS